MQKVQEIIDAIEQIAPRCYQENYDNSGLILGDKDKSITKALLTLDCTEAVVEEAIEQNCQMIIAHHPILFSGIKSLTGKNYIERVLIKAIKNDIAIYACHTNLDNMLYGVNNKIAEKLGLVECKILKPIEHSLYQLYVYVPIAFAEKVKEALFQAGAGLQGNYAECSFSFQGEGSYKPLENATPFIGTINKRHAEFEVKLEVLVKQQALNNVQKAMKAAHPYEEVAFGILELQNKDNTIGSGLIGTLKEALSEQDFFNKLKTTFNLSSIRHTKWLNKPIQKVALCGGSGSFLEQDALQQNADIFITSDYKYHQFFDAENRIVIADIGHYESEQFTPEIFYDILSKKFPKFALHLSSVNTNPVYYY